LYKSGVLQLIVETLPETENSCDFKEFIQAFTFIKIWVISTNSIHDREIIFYQNKLAGQGTFTCNLGRGLDIYQPVGKYELGWSGDLTLRKCKECTVNVIYNEFNGQEFQKMQSIMSDIRNLSKATVVRLNDTNISKSQKEEILNQALEQIDAITIHSTMKYAKACRKNEIKSMQTIYDSL